MAGTSDKQIAIARRLSRRMREMGIGQKELADLADTTKQQVWKLENAKVKLSPEWAERFAPYLQVSPSWLLMIDDAGSDDVEAPPPVSDDHFLQETLHSRQERVLLGIWRRLTVTQRNHLVGLLEAIVDDRNADAA